MRQQIDYCKNINNNKNYYYYYYYFHAIGLILDEIKIKRKLCGMDLFQWLD